MMHKVRLVLLFAALMSGFSGCDSGSDEATGTAVSSAVTSTAASSSLLSSPGSSSAAVSSVSSVASSTGGSSALTQQSSADVSSAASTDDTSSAAAVSSSADLTGTIERLTDVDPKVNGYANLTTLVITTETEQETVLTSVSAQSGWDDAAGFIQTIRAARVEYDNDQILLLYRHTESSGSVQVTVGAPALQDGDVVVPITREVPEKGTTDMAYYLFAYRVDVDTPTVTFLIDGTPDVITMASTQITCADHYDPVCGLLEVQCVTTPCDPVPTSYDNLCLLQSDASAEFFHTGACEDNDTIPTVDVDALVPLHNAFGLRLLQQQYAARNNLLLSPFSLMTALSMTYGGSYGETAEAFETLFGFDANLSVHGSFAALLPKITPKLATLYVANAIWPQTGYPVYAAFESMVTQQYGAAYEPLNYLADTDAYLTINDWVAAQTESKIVDLIAEPLPTSTRMVLVNAVYFNALWAEAFDENATATEPFYLSDDTPVDAAMMQKLDDFNYTTNDLYSAIEVPYTGREFSLIVLLPDTRETMEELLAALNEDGMDSVLDGLSEQQVQLVLPRFSFRWGTEDMSASLQALGLENPFSSEADFRRLSDVGIGELTISNVYHQTFIEVTEAGTEAAAASAVVIAETAAPAYATFRADRPFLFFIRDNGSGILLFGGVVSDPTEESEEVTESEGR